MTLSRSLPLLLVLGLIIFCLLECLSTPGSAVRNLPKPVWVMLIVFVPVVGAVGWLLAGRAHHHGHHGHHGSSGGGGAAGPAVRAGSAGPQHGPRTRPLGPDDDPDFLRELGRATERRRDEDGEPEART